MNVPAITVESVHVKLKLPARFGVTAVTVSDPWADGIVAAVVVVLYAPP